MKLLPNTLKIAFILLSVGLIVQCQKAPIIPDNTVVSPIDNSLDSVEVSGEEQYLNLDSDYIFDQSKLHTFELNIPTSNLAELNADPTAERYVEASLTFEGETISPVGVRYKGSIGAYIGCVSGGSWFNPSGYKTCSKLSMKIKINWQGREDHFYGLKKLQLHSMNQDDSQMRDRLGYWLFAQMGIPTPRAVHARLMINGAFAGLFILVEQVDGRFSRYQFDDGEGNVYKEVWPLTDAGVPPSDFTFRDALKTNEDDNPSFDIIRSLALELAQTDEDSALKNILDKWMDIDNTIGYAMVDRMIKHDDGPFHWYCTNNKCSPHNFYFVEEPINKKIHLIPWDLDNSFENITSPNQVTNIRDGWTETSNSCLPFIAGFGIQQRSAACDKLVYAMGLYEEEYVNLKQAFKEGAFSEASVNTMLAIWSNQIKPSTAEASEQFNDAVSLSAWENAINNLKSQCNIARNQ